MAVKFAQPICFLLALCVLAQGRLVSVISSPVSDLVSDGVHNLQQPRIMVPMAADVSCERIYGFLPCSSSSVGIFFMILVYGYLMSVATKWLSDGSEVLLEIIGPGIVGGLILPVLSSLPDALIVLASGLSGSKEVAQAEVSAGMGLLAGSTVLDLTVVWGSCVLFGKRLVKPTTNNSHLFRFCDYGVVTDTWTCYAAMTMVMSIIPFAIVQLAQPFWTNSLSHLAVPFSLILSVTFLISYCIFQVLQPSIQRRRLAYAKHKHVISGVLQHLAMGALGRLILEDGKPNEDVLRKVFDSIDRDGNGVLTAPELKALLVGIGFDYIRLNEDSAVQTILKDFDNNRDSQINFEEFTKWISNWHDMVKREAKKSPHDGTKLYSHVHVKTKEQHDMLDYEDDEVENIENANCSAFVAIQLLMLLLGIATASAFAHPFVDSVNQFSTATNIPSFFVAFFVLPFVHYSEAVADVMYAKTQKKRSAPLTFSQVYARVTMSHILCTAVFLGLIYVQDLTWEFSSEVLIILIVNLLVGIFASSNIMYPAWTCLVVYLLYPLSPLLVYFLRYTVRLP